MTGRELFANSTHILVTLLGGLIFLGMGVVQTNSGSAGMLNLIAGVVGVGVAITQSVMPLVVVDRDGIRYRRSPILPLRAVAFRDIAGVRGTGTKRLSLMLRVGGAGAEVKLPASLLAANDRTQLSAWLGKKAGR